jgi:hypothetical protein
LGLSSFGGFPGFGFGFSAFGGLGSSCFGFGAFSCFGFGLSALGFFAFFDFVPALDTGAAGVLLAGGEPPAAGGLGVSGFGFGSTGVGESGPGCSGCCVVGCSSGGASGCCSSTIGSGAASAKGSSAVVGPPSETSCGGAGGVRGASFSGFGLGFAIAGESGTVTTRVGGARGVLCRTPAPRGTSVTGNRNWTAANIVAPTADAAASGQARMRAASIKLPLRRYIDNTAAQLESIVSAR